MGSTCSSQIVKTLESHNVVVNLKTRIIQKSMIPMNQDPMEIFDDILIDFNQMTLIEVNPNLIIRNEILQIEAQAPLIVFSFITRYKQAKTVPKWFKDHYFYPNMKIAKVLEQTEKILENVSNEIVTFIPSAQSCSIEPSAPSIVIDIARLAKQQFILNCFMSPEQDEERPTTPQLHPRQYDNKSRKSRTSAKSPLSAIESDKLINKHLEKYQRKKSQHPKNTQSKIKNNESKLL